MSIAHVQLDFYELKRSIQDDERASTMALLAVIDRGLKGLEREIDELASTVAKAERAEMPESTDLIDQLQFALAMTRATDRALARLDDHSDMRAILMTISMQLRTRLAVAKHGRLRLVGQHLADMRAANARPS